MKFPEVLDNLQKKRAGNHAELDLDMLFDGTIAPASETSEDEDYSSDRAEESSRDVFFSLFSLSFFFLEQRWMSFRTEKLREPLR